MPDARIQPDSIPIGDALAALPQEAPERSAWPLLEQRILAAQPNRPLRWPLALAAAAVLALAAVMPGLLDKGSPAPGTPFVAAVENPDPLEALMAESAQLEMFISAATTDAMASASGTLVSLAFEDRLQHVDSALSDPALDDAARESLWQQRVSLLREYAGVQGTRQWLAAQGATLDDALVTTY
jgi:hypothetical protein